MNYFLSYFHFQLDFNFHLGPEHTGHFVQSHVAAHCGGDIYSRRKPLFSSFGEHTAVCGSSVRQAVARPRHRQSVCIHNIHVAATCHPSVLGSATMCGHMWLNKVASVLGPLNLNLRTNFYFHTNIYSHKNVIQSIIFYRHDWNTHDWRPLKNEMNSFYTIKICYNKKIVLAYQDKVKFFFFAAI